MNTISNTNNTQVGKPSQSATILPFETKRNREMLKKRREIYALPLSDKEKNDRFMDYVIHGTGFIERAQTKISAGSEVCHG